jgi:diguanylate cyclase (GGDEF)-like protein/PAS domain S-box-containing protein
MLSASPLYWSYMAALCLSAALSLILIGYVWPRRSAAGAQPLLGLLVSVIFWSVGYIMEYASNQIDAKLLAMNVSYIGMMSLPVMLLIFSLRYTHRDQWLKPRFMFLFFIIPIITLILQWTKDFHQLMYYDIHLVQDTPFFLIGKSYGSWFWVAAAYNYSLLLASIFVLIDRLFSPPRLFIDQAIYLLLVITLPAIANLIYIFHLLPIPHADWTPAVFAASAIALTLAISRHRFLEILPVARESAIELMSEGFLVIDDKERIVDFNRAMQDIIGFPPAKIHGSQLPAIILDQLKSSEDYAASRPANIEMELETKKETRCYSVHFSPLHIGVQHASAHVLVFYDITERKRMEDTVKQIAYYDALTGLPNRLLLGDRAEQALSSSMRYSRKTAIMVIDIDRFKQVNDTYGHPAGDQVLQDISLRFSSSVRKVDTVSRLGGDEFIVLLPEISSGDTLEIIAGRIIQAVSVPFSISGKEIVLSVSIGIAVFSQEISGLNELIKNADMAMYAVKQQGRNGYRIYNADMETQRDGNG